MYATLVAFMVMGTPPAKLQLPVLPVPVSVQVMSQAPAKTSKPAKSVKTVKKQEKGKEEKEEEKDPPNWKIISESDGGRFEYDIANGRASKEKCMVQLDIRRIYCSDSSCKKITDIEQGVFTFSIKDGEFFDGEKWQKVIPDTMASEMIDILMDGWAQDACSWK